MSPKRRKKNAPREEEFARLVAEETLIFDVTEEISRALDADGITRKELAEALGKTKGHVTQLLSGERNMTLRTAADLVHALDRRLHVRALALDGSFERPGQPSRCENPPEESFAWTGQRHSTHLAALHLVHLYGADLNPAESITAGEEHSSEDLIADHEFALGA